MDGPIISLIGISNLSKTAACLRWITDVPATTRIDYGTTSSYGSNATNSSRVTKHGVSISGLTAGTTYHYKLTSVDANGSSVATADLTFVARGSGYKPGDVDSDGNVGVIDLSIVLSNLNKGSRSFAQGNADGDPAGVVDNIDYALVLQNFGT